MKTLDLSRERVTLKGLLKLASKESVRILSADGHSFVLEEADDFDKEVELLSKSKKFRRFLSKRAKEPGKVSLSEYRKTLA